jgi:hypothetical protein
VGVKKPDDFDGMSDNKRRMLRLRKRFRHYKKQERPRLSAEEMLRYLRDRKFHSRVVLERFRKPTDPNTNDFRREFGSWSEATRQAFGSKVAVDFDAEYVLKAVAELNLWSVARFRAARKIDPIVVPSWRTVEKHWGSYRNLIERARRKNLKCLLEEYRKLIRKIGHIPSLGEIKAADLRMDEAIRFYGGKKQMDDFVITMGK